MNYIQKRSNGNYYYRRRVPKHVQPFTDNDVINLSLKTKDLHVAQRKAAHLSTQMEALWDDLWVNGGNSYKAKYQRAIKIAKMYGFSYLPTENIIDKGTPEILARLEPIENPPQDNENTKIESLLGGVKKPPLMVGECFAKFIEFSRADLVSKSEGQQKRWRSPREAALNSFISVVGNKPMTLLKNEWTVIDENYRYTPLAVSHMKIDQRWLVVHSKAAKEQSQKAIKGLVDKELKAINKDLFHLQAQRFACQTDAHRALVNLSKKQKYHRLEIEDCIEHKQYEGKGRPKKDAQVKSTQWQMIGKAIVDEAAKQQYVEQKSCFVLATNASKKDLKNESILYHYKAQSHAERGFRFLKEPLFFVSSLFIKKPSRIDALLMMEVDVEVRTNLGRIDCTVVTEQFVYVIEFKLNGTEEAALDQIENKSYWQKYQMNSKETILLGIAFAQDARNITGFAAGHVLST